MTHASALLEKLYADPPLPHIVDGQNTAAWATERAAYEFMARDIAPSSRTVETGCGMSTALFALSGCEHVCIAYDQHEVDYMVAYIEQRSGQPCTVEFHVGNSADILPRLELGRRDVVFIDGGHSWPMATIDWFYTAGSLDRGGLLVIDDTQLVHVKLGLTEFLAKDPRWERVRRGWKWTGYRRLSSGSLLDDWFKRDQPFLGFPLRDTLGQRLPPAARPALKRLVVRLRAQGMV